MQIVAILHIDTKQAMKYQAIAPWRVHGNHSNSEAGINSMITISIAQWQWCVCGYIEENDIAMQRRRCRSEVGGAGAAVRKLPPWKERRGGMSRSVRRVR